MTTLIVRFYRIAWVSYPFKPEVSTQARVTARIHFVGDDNLPLTSLPDFVLFRPSLSFGSVAHKTRFRQALTHSLNNVAALDQSRGLGRWRIFLWRIFRALLYIHLHSRQPLRWSPRWPIVPFDCLHHGTGSLHGGYRGE